MIDALLFNNPFKYSSAGVHRATAAIGGFFSLASRARRLAASSFSIFSPSSKTSSRSPPLTRTRSFHSSASCLASLGRARPSIFRTSSTAASARFTFRSLGAPLARSIASSITSLAASNTSRSGSRSGSASSASSLALERERVANVTAPVTATTIAVIDIPLALPATDSTVPLDGTVSRRDDPGETQTESRASRVVELVSSRPGANESHDDDDDDDDDDDAFVSVVDLDASNAVVSVVLAPLVVVTVARERRTRRRSRRRSRWNGGGANSRPAPRDARADAPTRGRRRRDRVRVRRRRRARHVRRDARRDDEYAGATLFVAV